ncbi:MAG: hypothetical protein RRA94_02585 [Bacteroidota bacterium]|nr:hypothetical protein [Bacteroidota bacterium]
MKNYNVSSTDKLSMQMKNRLLTILTALLLMVFAAPTALQAQSADDALTNVEQIMRYMKSANYSEDDLLRRMAWGDQIINEMVGFRPSEDDRLNYLRLLDIAIDHYQDENDRLRVLLRALTTLDPLVDKYFPQWIIQDEPMILEVMRKVRDNRDDLRDAEAVDIAERVLMGKARMRVIQSPKDDQNLIGIIIEKARPHDPDNLSAGFSPNKDNSDFDDYRIVGRRNLREILTPDLYEAVVDRQQYASLDETGALKPQPYVAEATISVPFGGGFMWTLDSPERAPDGVALQPSRIRAGFELKIGNDWVNLPFLYGAQWNTLFVYEPSNTERIKIGPSIPFTWGDQSIQDNFAIFKPRTINGTWGAAGEYFKQLSNISGAPGSDADGIGAAAFVSFGLNKLGNKKVTTVDGRIINGDEADIDLSKPEDATARFYYMASSANAFYWRDLSFMLKGLRIHAGIGYQKIVEASRKNIFEGDGNWPLLEDSVKTVSDHSTLDLWARLSYDHFGKTTYGVALQYFNGGLLGEVYLNIFSWMRAEVKYSRIVFRDAEIWEHEEMIVPGLRFGFAF